MFVTLEARLGFTEAAQVEAPLEMLVQEVKDSLSHFSSTPALKKVGVVRVEGLPGVIFDPADFPISILADFSDLSTLPGSNAGERTEAAREAIRQALREMDMVRNEDVSVVD